MPTELPTLAACPRCGAIVLRTSRELVHPMPEERERIRSALGSYWFHHEGTKFDGRLHRCVGCARQEPGAKPQSLADDVASSDGSDHGQRQTLRQEVRNRWKALVAVSLVCWIGGGPAWAADAHGPTAAPNGAAAATARTDRARVGRAARPNSEAISRLFVPQPTPLTPAGDRQLRTVVIETENDFVCTSPSTVGTTRPEADFSGGRYQVVEIVSDGEPVVVFRAHDRNLGAAVVITKPTRRALNDAEFPVRFLREARALAQLSHPHLVRITDVGAEGAAPFEVSESLPAGSLKFRRPLDSRGRPAPMSPEAMLEWLGDIAEALDFLHAQGHVHRDVRPANLQFDANGQAYLAGLGMAALLEETARAPSDSRRDEPGLSSSECADLAPERIMGRACDGRADQYSLAVIAYEMLSGCLPFEDHNSPERLVLQASQDPPALHQRLPAIAQSLSDVVQRGLARDPCRRYLNCMEFARAFTEAARSAGLPAGDAETKAELAGVVPAAAARTITMSRARNLTFGLAAGLLAPVVVLIIARQVRRSKSANAGRRAAHESLSQGGCCEPVVVRGAADYHPQETSGTHGFGTLDNPLVLDPRGRVNLLPQALSALKSKVPVAAAAGCRMLARQARPGERMPARSRWGSGEDRIEGFLATLAAFRSGTRRHAATAAMQDRSLVRPKPRWRYDVKPTGTALAGIHHAGMRVLSVSPRRRAG